MYQVIPVLLPSEMSNQRGSFQPPMTSVREATSGSMFTSQVVVRSRSRMLSIPHARRMKILACTTRNLVVEAVPATLTIVAALANVPALSMIASLGL